MEILSDDDLQFSPGGKNETLGELCRTIGQVEETYIQSFKTFKHDSAHRNQDPDLASNSFGSGSSRSTLH